MAFASEVNLEFGVTGISVGARVVEKPLEEGQVDFLAKEFRLSLLRVVQLRVHIAARAVDSDLKRTKLRGEFGEDDCAGFLVDAKLAVAVRLGESLDSRQ